MESQHDFDAHCRFLLTLLMHVVLEAFHRLANLVGQQNLLTLLRQPHLVTAIRRIVCLRQHGASLLWAFIKPCRPCSCDGWSLPICC